MKANELVSFTEYIWKYGDFVRFVVAVDKGIIREVTYPFITELILKNRKDHSEIAIYCIENFPYRINLRNDKIRGIFIRLCNKVGNIKMKRFIEKNYKDNIL